MNETLAVCEHLIPIKFKTCIKCNPEFDKKRDEYVYEFSIGYVLNKLTALNHEVFALYKLLEELKKFEAARQDVINSLFNKISELEKEIQNANSRR